MNGQRMVPWRSDMEGPIEHYVHVDGHAMPDIASMVNERISNPEELLCQYDTEAIGSTILRQLNDKRGGPALRLSASGGCTRAIAYNWHESAPTVPIDSASRMNFAIGDLTEVVIVAAIKECLAASEQPAFVLENTLEEQATVHIDVAALQIAGHPDGLMTVPLRNREDGSVEGVVRAVLEVKSMSDYGFRKFQREGLTENDSYYGQIQAYMMATKSDYTYVIAYGKQSTSKDTTPPFEGAWIPANPEYQEALVDKYRRVIASDSPEQFARIPPNRKGQLVFPCTYCTHLHTCHAGAYDKVEESKWLQKTTKVRTYAAKDNS